MQDLTEKNTHLSEELQECKAQLEAALAAARGATETPSGNSYFEKRSSLRSAACVYDLTIILQRVPD